MFSLIKKLFLDKEIEIQLNDYGLASSAFNSINNSREKEEIINLINLKYLLRL